MTTRYFTVTVTLEQEVREDDLEALMQSIRMLRGVRDVQPGLEANSTSRWAKRMAAMELTQKLLNILEQECE